MRELAARNVSAELIDAQFVNNRALVVAQKSGDLRRVEIWDAHSLERKRTITGSASALGPRELGANDTLMAQSYRVSGPPAKTRSVPAIQVPSSSCDWT